MKPLTATNKKHCNPATFSLSITLCTKLTIHKLPFTDFFMRFAVENFCNEQSFLLLRYNLQLWK